MGLKSSGCHCCTQCSKQHSQQLVIELQDVSAKTLSRHAKHTHQFTRTQPHQATSNIQTSALAKPCSNAQLLRNAGLLPVQKRHTLTGQAFHWRQNSPPVTLATHCFHLLCPGSSSAVVGCLGVYAHICIPARQRSTRQLNPAKTAKNWHHQYGNSRTPVQEKERVHHGLYNE